MRCEGSLKNRWECDMGRILALDIGEKRIGMAVSDPAKKHQKKNMVSKALKTMGDIVDNIGGSIGM